MRRGSYAYPEDMSARIAVVVAAAGLVLAGTAVAQSSTSLRITVWPDGKGNGSTTWTLRCNAIGGTLPNRARACRTLAMLKAPFAPVPRGTVCTEVSGGPAVAYIRGTFRGRPVRAWFDRSDGCQLDRWNRVRTLLPLSVSAR
jgi:Subtilisin inhibitor-like